MNKNKTTLRPKGEIVQHPHIQTKSPFRKGEHPWLPCFQGGERGGCIPTHLSRYFNNATNRKFSEEIFCRARTLNIRGVSVPPLCVLARMSGSNSSKETDEVHEAASQLLSQQSAPPPVQQPTPRRARPSSFRGTPAPLPGHPRQPSVYVRVCRLSLSLSAVLLLPLLLLFFVLSIPSVS